MKKLVIIGGVAAGATAAARARRLDGEAQITLLEAGADVSFANCGLPYHIGGEVQNRSSLILASPQTFHDQYRVDVHTNTMATGIDREAQTVQVRDTTNGQETTHPYDVLILAQGGRPVVPPIPGVDQDHVFQLWTLEDMDRINNHVAESNPSSAVVVGGGFIGLEMVEALVRRGLQVHVVEMLPQIMPNLEAEFAGFLTKELQDHGVALHTGRSVVKIRQTGVSLDDGTELSADLVLLSVGVRPTLSLAEEAGLEMGQAGGLKVDAELRTSDPRIYAAGDMIEIGHRVTEERVRIPLAGPANRQGRIAAENALGRHKNYRGALGSSIVKLFDAAAGSTGLSLKAARQAGLNAEAVTVHKVSHTAYYPNSQKVSLMVVYDPENERLLGAQAAGRVGVDKRLDVLATAVAAEMTLTDLSELDLVYSPPFNSPNGPVNMAAFTALNHLTGFSPAVLAQDAGRFIAENDPVLIDLRDPISYSQAALEGTTNLSQNQLRDIMEGMDRERPLLLISDDGQKGHVALRMLMGAGFRSVFNLSGGYISLERHARAVGSDALAVGLLPIDSKSAVKETAAAVPEPDEPEPDVSGDQKLIIDVRTVQEYDSGAFPGSVNIPLDELQGRLSDLGDLDREIIVYCASGARSSYARRILQSKGFTNVTNGGGLHDMMASGGQTDGPRRRRGLFRR
jgi:NADPH-dependent 2,4-dienoyl-CoA reductase/sulfur reductase-like enzyme/rhodanese-related sulfurtransferase